MAGMFYLSALQLYLYCQLDMIDSGYLRLLVVSLAIWLGLFLAFTWTVDPYGVSPLQVRLERVNVLKPKRFNIDRLIKPYEVWRYQPRTVFLGSSRAHQSFDPAVFDSTRFAPAYNAAIPASSVSENAVRLEQFFEIDRNLRIVFVELFFPFFLYPQPQATKKTERDVFQDSVSLFFSLSSVWDSGLTLIANAAGQPAPTVSPGGYFVPAASFTAKFNQQPWIDLFVKSDNPTKALDPTALAALDQMIAFCRAHGIELYLIVGPNHPWDDYRLLSLGYWPVLESWMRLLANHPNTIGFSYYAIPETPRYWNDPLHFNTVLGQLMMRLFLGTRSPEPPSNVLQPLTLDTIEAY